MTDSPFLRTPSDAARLPAEAILSRSPSEADMPLAPFGPTSGKSDLLR